MTKAINLKTNAEFYFDNKTVPVYAVAYAYCTQNNLTSEFFKHCHDFTLELLYKKLPINYGNLSISCGDWAAKLEAIK